MTNTTNVNYKDHFKVKLPSRADHLKPYRYKKGETGNPLLPDGHPSKRVSKKDLMPPWKPGESGNPKGRPIGIISPTEQLKAYLRRAPGEVVAIIEAWIKEGKAGNIQAIKELLDRVDGKVVERHQVEGELPIKLLFVPASQVLEKQKGQIVEGEVKELTDGRDE